MIQEATCADLKKDIAVCTSNQGVMVDEEVGRRGFKAVTLR